MKQKKYEMSFLDIVGVTSLGKELLCFVSKENVEHFRRLQDTA